MTAQLRWSKSYIDSLPVDVALHEATLDYSVALTIVAISIHQLNRRIYLAEQSPTRPIMDDTIKAMMSQGITLDMIREGLEKIREKNGTSRNQS